MLLAYAETITVTFSVYITIPIAIVISITAMSALIVVARLHIFSSIRGGT